MTDSATFTAPEADEEELGDLLLEVLPGDGSTRTALITFRNQQVSDKFERDLEIWAQTILRPIGPSVEISK